MRLTIVVVTFEQDLDLLDRLLSSIHQHWNTDSLHEVLIIFNSGDRNNQEFLNQIDRYSKLLPIRVLYREDLAPGYGASSGYVAQMFLKLQVAEQVNTDWYLLHDSKDYYVKSASDEDFFNAQGLAIGARSIGTSDTGHHQHALTRSFDLWPYTISNDAYYGTVTPFMIHTQSVLDMLAELKQVLPSAVYNNLFKLKILVCDDPWQSEFFITEFGLLNAWINHTNKTIQRYAVRSDEESHVDYNKFQQMVKRDKSLRRKNKTQ